MESIVHDNLKVRKLATVQIIKDIVPVPDSNNLSHATILGWKIVVQRDMHKIGEKIIFFEIDSLLPSSAPWAEVLKDCKYRVKTKKIRGAISQGLALSLSIIAKDSNDIINPDDYPEDMDLTDQLGIVKYENDADLPPPKKWSKNKNGEPEPEPIPYPDDLIEKSDEPRIQSSLKYIDLFKGKPFYSTLKYDGTSSTYLIDSKGTFYICSRNTVRGDDLKDTYSVIAKDYKIKEKLEKANCQYAIQGEIYGPKIQKNNLDAKKQQLAVFCIKDLVKNEYLGLKDMIEACKILDLPMVEIIEEGDSFNYTIDELLEKSKGTYPGTTKPREGLVYRLKENWHTPETRLSFKVINNDYLLKK